MGRRWTKIRAIIAHRKAYRATARQVDRVRLSDWGHDLDKIVLLVLGLSPRATSRLHRSWSRHHLNGGDIRDKRGAALDWESALLTKPDKPRLAWETCGDVYPGVDMGPVLRTLKLDPEHRRKSWTKE